MSSIKLNIIVWTILIDSILSKRLKVFFSNNIYANFYYWKKTLEFLILKMENTIDLFTMIFFEKRFKRVHPLLKSVHPEILSRTYKSL